MISETYLQVLAGLALFALLELIYFVLKYKKTIKQQELTINEQKEKLESLRKTLAENELQSIQTAHEVEKKMLLLNNSIESLNEKAKSGTKNQVVSKIEALQSTRERLLKRVNIGLD